MPLWGCDCPIPALAALACLSLEGDEPVHSRLALVNPLFCERAWRCLRAFRIVVISQSGLLAQVNSLRLPSAHSGPVLTLSNAAHTSLPSPRLLVADAGVCAVSLLGELLLGTSSVGFNYLFIFPPSYVALCGSKARHRLGSESLSWCLETSFLRLPSRDGAPSLPLLSFILFPTSLKQWAAFLGA